MLKAGGDCALISNTAFTICIFSSFTFIIFIVSAILYVILKKDIAKVLALIGIALNIGILVCSIILYAKIPEKDINGDKNRFERLGKIKKKSIGGIWKFIFKGLRREDLAISRLVEFYDRFNCGICFGDCDRRVDSFEI
jgi:hypothetical protein